MKKLEKLTLKELSNSVELIDETNAAILVGGSDNGDGGNNETSVMGWMEYYLSYGELLPENSYYDPATDTLNYINLTPPQYSPITTSYEEQFSQACAEGFKDAFNFLIGAGIAAVDISLLFFTRMPALGPDVSYTGTWGEYDFNLIEN